MNNTNQLIEIFDGINPDSNSIHILKSLKIQWFRYDQLVEVTVSINRNARVVDIHGDYRFSRVADDTQKEVKVVHTSVRIFILLMAFVNI